MKIKTFSEFIGEGLISKTIMRNKSGEKRLEDKCPLNDICDYITQIISKKFNIEHNKDICTWEISDKSLKNITEYLIKISVYNISFQVNIHNENFNNEKAVAYNISDSIYGNYIVIERKTKTTELMKSVFISLITKYNIGWYKNIMDV